VRIMMTRVERVQERITPNSFPHVPKRCSLTPVPRGRLTRTLALSLGGTGGGTLAEKGGRAGIDDDPARETPILSLRQIAPAGFLTQSFAVDWSAGCAS
jgi:hypothetical protein